ncbi:S1C family serine protease [Rhodohalobacter sp. 614A]|uniref:S1C family serine protease n=1 Tax=Rhodohalobacter sp. 614A TaxID=2908649 RepID=UPI001F338D10|nr:trypsin-like peptidase domain-containing protein [Rhodohalobacter sp. 614A]
MKHLLFYSTIIAGFAVLLSCSNPDAESGISLNPDEEPFSAAYIEEDSSEETRPDSERVFESPTETISANRANAITNAVEKASPAIVSIVVTSPARTYAQDEFFRFFFGEPPRENTSMGSGFVISEDGLVVTNQHVVGRNPSEITISTPDGESYQAELIGSDELTDIALLRIDSNHVFPFVELSNSDEIMVGEWSIAMGNPFGLFDDGNPTVTVGVVSAVNRDFRPDPNNPRTYIDMIQTDAAINRGNSGGPLLNSNGEVIGINTFIYTGGTSAGFVGLGFAIPSNRVEKIISQLLTSGSVVLDYNPGMEFTSMTEQLVYRYRLPYVSGLLVTSVNKDGPAYECGIMPGDIIVRIGQERVASRMHAMALLREYEEGEKMHIELIREGNLYKTEMSLRQKASEE